MVPLFHGPLGRNLAAENLFPLLPQQVGQGGRAAHGQAQKKEFKASGGSGLSPVLLKALAERGRITEPDHLKKAGVVGAGMIVLFVMGEQVHLLPAVTALIGATALLVWIRPDIEEMIEAVDWFTAVFFLALLIVAFSFTVSVNITALTDSDSRAELEQQYPNFPGWYVPCITLCAALNIVWAIALLRWKKWSFYAMMLTCGVMVISSMYSVPSFLRFFRRPCQICFAWIVFHSS